MFNDTTKDIEDRSASRCGLAEIRGESWKRIRNSVTPAFTSGKMRRIIPIFNESVRIFCDALSKMVEGDKEIPLKEYVSKKINNE